MNYDELYVCRERDEPDEWDECTVERVQQRGPWRQIRSKTRSRIQGLKWFCCWADILRFQIFSLVN